MLLIFVTSVSSVYPFSTDDKEVAKKIALKFGNPEVEGYISFCNIAKKAEEVGKRELAIMVTTQHYEQT